MIEGDSAWSGLGVVHRSRSVWFWHIFLSASFSWHALGRRRRKQQIFTYLQDEARWEDVTCTGVGVERMRKAFRVVDDDTDQNGVLERYRSTDIGVDATYNTEDLMCAKHIYASALTVAQMGPRT